MDNSGIDWGNLLIGIVALVLFAVGVFWCALEIRDRRRQIRKQRGDECRQQALDEIYDAAVAAWRDDEQEAQV